MKVIGPKTYWPEKRQIAYKRAVHPLFDRLSLWHDPVPRQGPEQMACDEALCESVSEPVLRVFRWAAPWCSAGYFSSWQEASGVRPDLPLCRRWTGGGVVVHENDFTFALIAPKSTAWSSLRPVESYRVLHEALADTLRETGEDAGIFRGTSSSAAQCFVAPTRHDVVGKGTKLAGGAQRRTRTALLHQGSVQAEGAKKPGFAEGLAARLAGIITDWQPSGGLQERVHLLLEEKYGRPSFLERIP